MNKVDSLHELYKLDDRQFDRITKELIEDNAEGITSQERPRVVILGGQPGSGKGELTSFAVDFLNENAIICNADDYRDRHPKSEEIKELHEIYYPEITVKYSHQWNNLLVEHCIQNKLNFILETTFSSGQGMNDTIERFKNAGYEVHLKIIAVNGLLSYVGTRLRYENMKSDFNYGRLVDKNVHDEKYKLVEETLSIVQAKLHYDGLYIYARAGRQNVKGKKNGLVLLPMNDSMPLEIYIAERDKEWSVNDRRYFMIDILGLIKMMVGRKAPYKELKEIIKIADTDFLEAD